MILFAWLAAALVFSSFFMKTIVPLRTLAIASNVAFIGYGLLGIGNDIFAKVAPILVLHGALLPLNVLRLREIKRSIRAVRSMQSGEPAADFLRPYMLARSCPAGTVLFRQGDLADNVYVLQRGTLRIPEFDATIQPGEIFGEIGVFHENARRTASAVCESDCEILYVPSERLLELFYQDQKFAFQIARRLSRYA